MSQETVFQILKNLPEGCHVHRLDRFINGRVSLTKFKTVKMTIEIGIAELGSPHDDIHAVLSPFDNKLIPVLMFVEPSVYLANKAKGEVK